MHGALVHLLAERRMQNCPFTGAIFCTLVLRGIDVRLVQCSALLAITARFAVQLRLGFARALGPVCSINIRLLLKNRAII